LTPFWRSYVRAGRGSGAIHTWPYGQRKRRLCPDLCLPEGGCYGPRGYNMKQILDGNPRRPMFVIDKLNAWDDSWSRGYNLVSYGLVPALVPDGQRPSFEEWATRDSKAMANYDSHWVIVYVGVRLTHGRSENSVSLSVETAQLA